MSRSFGVLAVVGLLVACSDVADKSSATSALSTSVVTTVAESTTTDAPSTTVAITSSSGDPGVNFSFPEGNFEAYFPAEPAVFPGSPTLVESDGVDGFYSVSFGPYDKAITADDLTKFALAADHMVTETYGATLTESVAVELDGVAGRQAKGFTDTDDIWVTIHADGQRIYTLVSVVTSGEPRLADEARGFHEHFHIIGVGS